MKKWFISGIVIFVFASCGGGGSNGWSQTERDTFVKSCVPQAQQSAGMDAAKAKDYCECMLNKVEKKYPKAEDAAGLTAIDASTMAKDCLK